MKGQWVASTLQEGNSQFKKLENTKLRAEFTQELNKLCLH